LSIFRRLVNLPDGTGHGSALLNRSGFFFIDLCRTLFRSSGLGRRSRATPFDHKRLRRSDCQRRRGLRPTIMGQQILSRFSELDARAEWKFFGTYLTEKNGHRQRSAESTGPQPTRSTVARKFRQPGLIAAEPKRQELLRRSTGLPALPAIWSRPARPPAQSCSRTTVLTGAPM